MGGAVGAAINFTKSVTTTIGGNNGNGDGDKDKNDDKDEERDPRRRNSLAFYIAQFVNYEGDDFGKVVEAVKADKFSKNGGKAPNIRNSSKSYSLSSLLSPHTSSSYPQLFSK